MKFLVTTLGIVFLAIAPLIVSVIPIGLGHIISHFTTFSIFESVLIYFISAIVLYGILKLDIISSRIEENTLDIDRLHSKLAQIYNLDDEDNEEEEFDEEEAKVEKKAFYTKSIPRNSPCPCGSGRKNKNCCNR